MKLLPILLAAFALSILPSCEEPKTPVEKVEDKVKDGLDARPGEKVKDAGEEVKDAVKDATN